MLLQLPYSDRHIWPPRCRALFDHQWPQNAWSTDWKAVSTMTKELVPIMFSCAIWVPLLAQSPTEIQCDNLSLVEAVNKGTSKDPIIMHLL